MAQSADGEGDISVFPFNNPQSEHLIISTWRIRYPARDVASSGATPRPGKYRSINFYGHGKVPLFAQQLQHLHGLENWTLVIKKTAAMLTGMGRYSPIPFSGFSNIQCPVLLMLGDRDKQVTLVETETVFKQIGQGQLAILPDTAHALATIDCQGVAVYISRFIGL